MRTFAFVFARGGSKGIPKKNLQLLDGKPLLGWSIEMGQSLPEVEKVFVSTDDAEIADVASDYNAEIIKRPEQLAKDDSSEWFAWQHAIKCVEKSEGKFDRFLSLPTTAPLRSQEDVRKCLEFLDEQTDIVITITPASRSPWFNMVSKDENGHLELLLEGNYVRRQDAPTVYDVTTLAYVLRPSFILNNDRYWEGLVRGVEIPRERSLDIDTPLDLEIARLIKSRISSGKNRVL